MGTVTFETRTQIGEKVYEKGEVAALTARLEDYVLERKLAVPGGQMPEADVVELDFPKAPGEDAESAGADAGDAGSGGTEGADGGAGTGEPPANGAGDSSATGGQAQPPQAPARKSAAKKTANKQG